MYYPCSENKDANQLRGYREADLRLCFCPCKLLVFSRTGSFRFLFGCKPGCKNLEDMHHGDPGTNTTKFEPVHEKTNELGSDQVQHKPGCTVTEDGKRLEILDLKRRGSVLSV